MIWLCIAVRIIANPFSNVFQKTLTHRAADPLFIICVTHGLLSVACIPAFFYLPPLATEFWFNIATCAVLAIAGNVLIVEALKLSDLSVLGPINAYKAVVGVLSAMILLHEFPGPMGLSGIALIIAGSYFIVDGNQQANAFVRFFKDKGIQFRFAALILSAIEAVFLKKALLASSPLTTFVFWSVLGFAVSIIAVLAISGMQIRLDLRVLGGNWLIYLMLFVTTGLMQLCTIVILEGFQVGYALALFQTSALISVVLGHKLFQEGHFTERLIGATVMVIGAVLIILAK